MPAMNYLHAKRLLVTACVCQNLLCWYSGICKGSASEAPLTDQPPIVQQLENPDAEDRLVALRQILLHPQLLEGSERRGAMLVANAIKSPSAPLREYAMDAMHQMVLRKQEGAMEALRSIETNLIAALDAPLTAARGEEAALLALTEPAPTNAIPSLLHCAKTSGDRNIVSRCIEAVGLIGRSNDTVARELLSMSFGADRGSAIAATRALQFHQGYTEQIISALLPMAVSTNYLMAEQALNTISYLTFWQPAAVPELGDNMVALVRNGQVPENIRIRAAGSVLAKLVGRDSSVAGKLVDALGSQTLPLGLQVAVLQAIQQSKEPSQAVLGYARGAAESASQEVRSQANETLKTWGVKP